MSITSKSIFSFLAGAATVVAAKAFLSSENGLKARNTVANRLRNIRKDAHDSLDSDWLHDFSDSAIHGIQNFRKEFKL